MSSTDNQHHAVADKNEKIRLGLALSGGGFRASLFHIGVLAQLAERDLLRHVSVISTVSGGSIIGAYYYLKVKHLLEGQRKDHLQPSAAAFRQLVWEVEQEFIAAVQKNMRVSAFSDANKNAQMMGERGSTSRQMAELFDQYFFQAPESGGKVFLRDLAIRASPTVSGDDCYEIPRLILNATVLNTGRLWQFTESYVGEADIASVAAGATAMPMLGRVHFGDPGLEWRQRVRMNHLTLGDAVAGSCCVPGIFDPLRLRGLFRDETGGNVEVELVDGGLVDNQGLSSLFEAQCSHIICSDAADLLKWQVDTSQRMIDVLMRSNDIMMHRIRGELLLELFCRHGQYTFVHLSDKDGQALFPVDGEQFLDALTKIRTDLDCFSDMEVSALMYYGYHLSGLKLDQTEALPFPELCLWRQPEDTSDWRFQALGNMLQNPAERALLLRHLEVGSRQFFKLFYLGKLLPFFIVMMPLLIPVALLAVAFYHLPPLPLSIWVGLSLLGLSVIAYSKNTIILERLNQFAVFRRIRQRVGAMLRPLGIPVLLGAFLAVIGRIQLSIFDRLFLKYGKLPQRPGRLGLIIEKYRIGREDFRAGSDNSSTQA